MKMSSLVVEHLLRNRLLIKLSPYEKLDELSKYSSGNFSDDFNNLIIVEKKIKELYTNDLLSDFDIEIINFVSDGKPLSDARAALDRDRTTISKNFSIICERIAYFLGGSFTDEGLIEELTEKYNLTEKQVAKAYKYLENRKGNQ